MKYVIINSSDLDGVDFDQLLTKYPRKSLDGSKALLKFDGDTPSFLIGEPQYSLEEIAPIMKSAEWFDPSDDI